MLQSYPDSLATWQEQEIYKDIWISEISLLRLRSTNPTKEHGLKSIDNLARTIPESVKTPEEEQANSSESKNTLATFLKIRVTFLYEIFYVGDIPELLKAPLPCSRGTTICICLRDQMVVNLLMVLCYLPK